MGNITSIFTMLFLSACALMIVITMGDRAIYSLSGRVIELTKTKAAINEKLLKILNLTRRIVYYDIVLVGVVIIIAWYSATCFSIFYSNFDSTASQIKNVHNLGKYYYMEIANNAPVLIPMENVELVTEQGNESYLTLSKGEDKLIITQHLTNV